MEMFAWSVVWCPVKDELKCVSRVSGALLLMMASQIMMQLWSANNLDISRTVSCVLGIDYKLTHNTNVAGQC